MAQKKPFLLRLNPDVQKALEKWATDEFRSLNGQIEYLLFQQLKENGRLPKPPAAEEKDNNGDVGS
ncbi:MAG: Arc family DNA binding domain-containing protein [Ferruginibacter sp.]|nr:Arc family DNA binding domain-containing protein [Cytophagales bacterium]